LALFFICGVLCFFIWDKFIIFVWKKQKELPMNTHDFSAMAQRYSEEGPWS